MGKTKTKKHPLIQEILLGRTVKEVCDQLQEKYRFEGEAGDKLEDIVQALIKANKPNVVFYAEENDYNSVRPINLDWDIGLDYWDHEDNYWREDEAFSDCGKLNEVVEELFGKRKPYKVNKDQNFLMGKKGFACPCCGRQGIHLSEDRGWLPRPGDKNPDKGEIVHEIGCKKCGYTWQNRYKVTLDRVG
jgi:transcription elongation factor Elf1